MTIRIYNTLTRRKEPFEPADRQRVTMYFCGPTPYSHTHIGHLRPALTGDIIARYLKHRGFGVRYISNFTDIDDKIIQRSREEGLPPSELSDRHARAYLEILEAMGIDQVERFARVTQEIPEIIGIIQGLVEGGHAYPLEGDVYYDITSLPDYGKLSGRATDDMLAGARVAVDERKRHPMDFALWKGARPGEPSWESPWGPGRPGWHIECSAMSLKYLGETIDIHGGGEDLIFPHHENEIAQSEAYTGCVPFVRYWVHNGLIQINEEKMSKSLGNFITAADILARFSPGTIRYFMLSTHYRNPLNFSWQTLEEAERGWQRMVDSLAHFRRLLDQAEPRRPEGGSTATSLVKASEDAQIGFHAAMEDDFNTALAMAPLFELVRVTNAVCHDPAFRPEGDLGAALAKAADTLETCLRVLGFSLSDHAAQAGDEDGELVRGLLALVMELRQEARQERDWALADRIRNRLAALGIVLEDTPQGITTYHRG